MGEGPDDLKSAMSEWSAIDPLAALEQQLGFRPVGITMHPRTYRKFYLLEREWLLDQQLLTIAGLPVLIMEEADPAGVNFVGSKFWPLLVDVLTRAAARRNLTLEAWMRQQHMKAMALGPDSGSMEGQDG